MLTRSWCDSFTLENQKKPLGGAHDLPANARLTHHKACTTLVTSQTARQLAVEQEVNETWLQRHQLVIPQQHHEDTKLGTQGVSSL